MDKKRGSGSVFGNNDPSPPSARPSTFSQFWKRARGLMGLNKAACATRTHFQREGNEKARVTVCQGLMRSWSVIPEGGAPIWPLLGLIEQRAGRCVSVFSLLRPCVCVAETHSAGSDLMGCERYCTWSPPPPPLIFFSHDL